MLTIPVLAFSARPALAQPSARMVSASTLVDEIRRGETVDQANLTVSGDLDLRSIREVTAPVRCLDCDFLGRVEAPDVVFDRIVVLSGAHFFGQIDLRGAIFRDGLIIRTSVRPSTFERFALFSLATFSRMAAFDQTTFRDEGNFTSARFLGDASFVDTSFLGVARFTGASFEAGAMFSGSIEAGGCAPGGAGAFGGDAVFTRALFGGSADFRGRCFAAPADFSDATFLGRTNFSLSQFGGSASFEGVDLEGDGLFLGARFGRRASFAQLAGARSVDFQDAQFSQDVTFARLAVSGSLSFDGASFHRRVDMGKVIARTLILPVAAVAHVRGRVAEERILSLIETSAKDRGDLRTANDARFQLLSLENRDSSGPRRWLDSVFYRTIGGYLVRPLHPLVAFLVLLLVSGVIRAGLRVHAHHRTRRHRASRAATGERRGGRAGAATRAAPLALVTWLSALFEGLGDATSAAFRAKPATDLGDREQVRPYLVAGLLWAESLAFKLLIALVLLGIANSNATLRQIVDNLRV